MLIIPRYLTRSLIGPYLFALFTIIFIFLTNVLIQDLHRFLGRGLSAWQIFEYLGLSLGWIIALAGPMSLLVAIMMVFGKLSQDNEYTALRACGYSLYKIMFHLTIVAGIIFYLNFIFGDRILPEMNHKLRMLTQDIRRKKPTISFSEGIFSDSENGIPGYRIMFRKISKNSGDVKGVLIYDNSQNKIIKDRDKNRQQLLRIITAERGNVKFDYARNKIVLDLFNGEIHEANKLTFEEYKRHDFEQLRESINVPNLSLVRTQEGMRSDREMNSKMMRDYINEQRNELIESDLTLKKELENEYKRGFKQVSFLKKLREKQENMSYTEIEKQIQKARNRIFVQNAAISAKNIAINKVNKLNWNVSNKINRNAMIDSYIVEIYKKYSIPASCFVFVLIGIPLGLMARSGKIGVSGGISLIFFLIYWSFLIAGEELVDAGHLGPFWAMWAPNILVGSFGMILMFKTAKEAVFLDFGKLKVLIPKRFR
ncbi:LptF/LptG family permease [candidate division KSB1 bacterium]